MRPWIERVGRDWIKLKVRLGVPVPLRTNDRWVLEKEILPYYASLRDIHRVLFVGTAWYTAHYPTLLPGREFWTLEPVPQRRIYGAAKHIVDTLDHLGSHVADGSFDLIMVNGVIGYGLDDPATIERSLASVCAALRPGGHLLLGWDDVQARRPVTPEQIEALRAFVSNPQPPFGSFRHAVDDENRKMYDFYIKPR